MNLHLSGKRVLVTGASRGIGLACAQSFAAEGARLVLTGRDAQALQEAARQIADQNGTQAEIVVGDLAESGAAERLAAQAGEVDILVNNAGAIPGGGLEQVDEARWRAGWELKVYGFINLARCYYPRMREAGSGVVVNVIGMAGASPRPDYLCGAAANAALIAFTRALGAQAPDHGVRVFGVNPSRTRTDRVVTLARQKAQARFNDPDRWEETLTGLPFNRLMEPSEVADLVVFGCSPRAGYLSGTVIDLDGGEQYAGR